MEVLRQHERVAAVQRRSRARPRIHPGRHADQRLLRRRPQGRQPLRGEPARDRGRQRQAACGTSRACTTACGTTTFPPRRRSSTSTSTARRIKAVAQVSKQGFTYVFDRATGKPVWPIEERPVPQSTVPGEKTAPTQPFPTKPPPFAPAGIHDRRPDRLHAGAARGSAADRRRVHARAAVHAADRRRRERQEGRAAAAERSRRRELGRRRLRSRNGLPVPAVGEHRVAGRRREGRCESEGPRTQFAARADRPARAACR